MTAVDYELVLTVIAIIFGLGLVALVVVGMIAFVLPVASVIGEEVALRLTKRIGKNRP